MKNKLWFVLLILMVLTDMTFCVKDNTLPVSEEPASKSTYDEYLTDTTKPVITATIAVINCTAVRFEFHMTYISGIHVINNGVCLATTPNPTIEDNVGYNSSHTYMGDLVYHTYSLIDDLQPETLYHARPYLIIEAGLFYGEDISFITNPRPTIITAGVTDITRTSAKVTGNITSTGGSFVVARGICYDTVPDLATVIQQGNYEWASCFDWANHRVEQEVQSCDAPGSMSVAGLGMNPANLPSNSGNKILFCSSVFCINNL